MISATTVCQLLKQGAIPYKMIYWREKYLANLSLKYNWRILYWRFVMTIDSKGIGVSLELSSWSNSSS